MDTKKLFADDSRERERLERADKGLVDVGIVLGETLGTECEELGHVAALVVAAEQIEAVGVQRLERVEQQQHLDREAPAVNVVAEKEIVFALGRPADLQQPQQVVVLSVDVPADCS